MTTIKDATATALRTFVRERSAQVGYNEAMRELREMVADLRLHGSAPRHHVHGEMAIRPGAVSRVKGVGAL